jgi:hypothetical protein
MYASQEAFSIFFKAHRLKNRLSIEEVAEDSGIPLSVLKGFENGTFCMPMSSLHLLKESIEIPSPVFENFLIEHRLNVLIQKQESSKNN